MYTQTSRDIRTKDNKYSSQFVENLSHRINPLIQKQKINGIVTWKVFLLLVNEWKQQTSLKRSFISFIHINRLEYSQRCWKSSWVNNSSNRFSRLSYACLGPPVNWASFFRKHAKLLVPIVICTSFTSVQIISGSHVWQPLWQDNIVLPSTNRVVVEVR